MNETEETNDGRIESCSSVSSECQPDEQNSSQAELETMRFTVEEDVVNKLASGVVDSCQPDLVKSKKLLTDVTESQLILIETLQQENAKFTESQAIEEVTRTMERARQYHAKLVNIKKEMCSLHEKSAQLKRRALKIQQQKQTEALHVEQRRERELERERALTARDVSKKALTSRPR